jgi:hypothetical protein
MSLYRPSLFKPFDPFQPFNPLLCPPPRLRGEETSECSRANSNGLNGAQRLNVLNVLNVSPFLNYGSPKHLVALSQSIFRMTSSPRDFHASTLSADSGKRDSA